ncbi:MAG: hypothetical protein KKA28_04785 [Planctomycetes bacterium]|nr:hypothetical protein [Planctomycetota bacterium]MCG2685313.1 hypothetical protein [Planctomycetales bacterium]
MAAKKIARSTSPGNGNGLIAEYEWLRRMISHLEMQTERIDQQLIEMENRLPDDYNFPGDPPKGKS